MKTIFRLRLWVLILSTLTVAIPALAQTNTVILKIHGSVAEPLDLTLTNLEAMPQRRLDIQETSGDKTSYEGVELYDLVMRAKPILTDGCCSNAINTVVVVKAADNFQAVFSLAELNPKISRREFLLALKRDDQPLDTTHGPLEIIANHEAVHARWVRQVNFIEVLSIGDRSSAATNSLPP